MKKNVIAAIAASFVVLGAFGKAAPLNLDDWDWKEGTELGVFGRGFADAEPYARIPLRAKGVIADRLVGMGQQSTGMFVDFTTDSNRLAIMWDIKDAAATDAKISSSGLYGIDLYTKAPDAKDWRFVTVGRVRNSQPGLLHNEMTLSWTPGASGRVYLPFRGETATLKIGVRKGRRLEAAQEKPKRRVVHYGTSLVHGGCVDRAGMVFTSIYGRLADVDVVNLGFSGAAKLEPEMVAFVAEPEADLYVVDAALNNVAPVLEQNLGPFVRSLAAKRPDKPILVCEPANTFEKETDRSLATRKVFEELKADGLNVYLIRTDELMIPDSEGTVDGCHPNAYGAIQMGRAFAAKIREILK